VVTAVRPLMRARTTVCPGPVGSVGYGCGRVA